MGYRVSIWSALYLPHTGGVENFTLHISQVLAARGHDVQIVTLRIDDSPEQEILSNGVRIWRLPAKPLMGGRLPIANKNARYRRLLGEVERFEPQHVLVNARFYGHSLDGLAFARRCGVIPVLLDHGSAHLTVGNAMADKVIARYEHAVTNRAKRTGAAFYGISQNSVEWLQHFGIDALGVVPNAIDAPAFRALSSRRDFRTELGIAPDDFLVAYSGRLAPEKGPDRLLDALALLDGGYACEESGDVGTEGELVVVPVDSSNGCPASGRRIVAVLAGEGAMRPQLESKARTLNSSDGRAFAYLPGNLSSADLSALLQQADLFCLPTRSEGFCTSLLEASACAVPSAIPDVGGARELLGMRESSDDRGVDIGAECGFIMPDREVETVASMIAAAASIEPGALRAIGDRARIRVESCSSWNASADALERAWATADARTFGV